MTQSLEQYLARYHRDKFVLISFGHIELLTDEIVCDYLDWCKTDEGRQYLKGGSKYNENHKGNIAADKAREESIADATN